MLDAVATPRARTALLVLTLGFGLIALAAGRAGVWVVALAAAVLGAGWRRCRALVEAALSKSQGACGVFSSVAKTEDTSGLWQEYRKTGDRGVRDRLILTYAPLVKFVAGRLGSGLPAHVDEGDLVSYGLLGLIGAIERFDPDREIKFEMYAIARIKGAIIDELRALDWVPRSVRARARDIERAIAELEKKLHRAPTDEEIAAKLSMTEDELGASLTEISRSSIAALDELWTVSSGGDQIALIDTIEDTQGPEPQSALAQVEQKEALGERSRGSPSEEARRHPLLLRGADAPRDRRGARRHRVPRLAAAHEGDPPFKARLGGAARVPS